ncbi:two component transcriptional regulator, LuxR family [Poseidonocella pacifica]|uniref:Two component transcriptional regulator, LuxR family n=1 Tax=Poseidonocella pacifica TaxID=871651 RepID=A0A1I0YIT8_9RHOB|nr:response regulator transcription factor [Poseidonocella pacifica]SFB12268.1 two component transcriptional regulator, LuxR family [Poseidonocella pacifica]
MIHGGLGNSPNRMRMLVIDDHPLYGDALAATLAQLYPGSRIVTATSLGAGLRELGPDFSPDLVMLDLKLPDVTGISGFLRLRDAVDEAPIVVVSAIASSDVVQAVMGAGASGFVPKETPVAELSAALAAVVAGEIYLPPEYRGACSGPAPRATDMQDASERIAALTPQQLRIMKLICAGKPNKQIAYELSLAEATVKAHITALLRRLGVQNRTQAAVLMESASFGAGPNGSADAARVFLTH